MSNQKKEIMPRDTYRRIKSMTREEMSDFMFSFSQDIVNDVKNGLNNNIDIGSMKSEIGQIKGIGQSRLDEIMSVIEKYLDNR